MFGLDGFPQVEGLTRFLERCGAGRGGVEKRVLRFGGKSAVSGRNDEEVVGHEEHVSGLQPSGLRVGFGPRPAA